MMIPTVHLNGTSREALISQLESAVMSLDAAIMALGEAAPHGRDYYPQGPDAYSKARGEHDARLQKLDEVKRELEHQAAVLFGYADSPMAG